MLINLKSKCQIHFSQKRFLSYLGSSSHSDLCPSCLFGLFQFAILMAWNVMIDSWDWHIDWLSTCIDGASSPWLHPPILQMCKMTAFVFGIFLHNFWFVGGSGELSVFINSLCSQLSPEEIKQQENKNAVQCFAAMWRGISSRPESQWATWGINLWQLYHIRSSNRLGYPLTSNRIFAC